MIILSFNCDKFSALKIIIETVLAIPVSNAFTERIFSIVNNLWTDERNKLSNDLVKAELCIKLNYSMNCTEFVNHVKTDQKLLDCAKSDNKYTFKHKK